MSIYSDAYDKYKNLLLASKELGIPLATLHYHLKKEGVKVVGNKAAYGSISDKFGAKAENLFHRLVPSAKNNNDEQFQAKVDFYINGASIDVKGSNLTASSKACKNRRWAFSFKKQESLADYFVCIGFDEDKPVKYWLIIGDLVRFYQSVSISESGKSKWTDFEVSPEYLIEFFEKTLVQIAA